MDFTLENFANEIVKNLYDNFPYESDFIKEKKHLKRPLHIRDIALGLPFRDSGKVVFEIGNDYAEEYYPYYHILEDSEVIRKRGKGTKQSKGSQDLVDVAGGKRDYGRIQFNGKTFSQEYRKNVRGERSRIGKATYKIVGSDGVVYKINQDASYYRNIHYHYIERILDNTLPWIAQEFGLKMGRTQISSLEVDYEQQSFDDTIVNIFNSFDEE